MTTLPVLDVAVFLSDPGSLKAKNLAIKLRDICHVQGFCYLVGHGMRMQNRAITQAAQQFFELPLTERESLSITNSPHFRGYTVLGAEQTKGKSDWRDQIDFGDEAPAPKLGPSDPQWHNLRGPNQWPENQSFLQPAVTDFMDGMHNLGQAMIAGLAMGLGLQSDYFASYFTPKGDARLKLIRYYRPGAGGTNQGVGWHQDTGFLTFILQDRIGGLQVDIKGQIIDATPLENAFIMNLGEMLQVATGGYLRATPHRVISPPPGKERRSVAYFFNPKLEAEFTPVPLPPKLARRAIGLQNTDPNDSVFNTVGENILKTRLRAHPDVAAKYYG